MVFLVSRCIGGLLLFLVCGNCSSLVFSIVLLFSIRCSMLVVMVMCGVSVVVWVVVGVGVLFGVCGIVVFGMVSVVGIGFWVWVVIGVVVGVVLLWFYFIYSNMVIIS